MVRSMPPLGFQPEFTMNTANHTALATRAIALGLALLVNVALLSVVHDLANDGPFMQSAQTQAASTVAATPRAARRG